MTAPHVLVGSGDTKVICLHGWFGSSTGWGAFPEYLDGERFTYAFPDYRGYGERKDEPGEHTMAEISADTLALADDLGWDTFDLVGHSMGGMAVQRVLADAPDRVRKIVAISPVPAGGVPFDEQSWGLFSSAAADDGSRAAIIDFTTGNRLTRTWIDAVVAHSVERSTREAFGEYLLAWAKTDFADEIAGRDCAVKVIVGEHDPALGEDTMRATFLQHYPKCELEVLPNAGHYAMFETPVALATSVEKFLAG
jgi:pimeloyl-ACP methyl ester carboxylesterase